MFGALLNVKNRNLECINELIDKWGEWVFGSKYLVSGLCVKFLMPDTH
jgi:hypothetical protein